MMPQHGVARSINLGRKRLRSPLVGVDSGDKAAMRSPYLVQIGVNRQTQQRGGLNGRFVRGGDSG